MSEKSKRLVLLRIYRNVLDSIVPDASMTDDGQPISTASVRRLHTTLHRFAHEDDPSTNNRHYADAVDLLNELSNPRGEFSVAYSTDAERLRVVISLSAVVSSRPLKSAAPYYVPSAGWGY